MKYNFHHLGLACRDFDKELKALELIGYQRETTTYDDHALHIKCCFLTAAPAIDSQTPRIELVSPLLGATVLNPWLDQGTKLYHLAYFVSDITAELERLRANRCKVVIEPTPAVAFGGKRVSFVMLPNMLLTELIEE